MHPYIEIIFCIALITLGGLMLRRLASLKNRRSGAEKLSYAMQKYRQLMTQKLFIRLAITLLMLALVVTSLILIEKGSVVVKWSE